jgi:hypothetical protein
MKLLSQAILKGCEMSPEQDFGTYCERRGDLMATCAFGAAAIAQTGLTTSAEEIAEAACQLIRGLPKDHSGCPVGCRMGEDDCLYYVVTHLNDDHRWTREQIAAWLDEQGL